MSENTFTFKAFYFPYFCKHIMHWELILIFIKKMFLILVFAQHNAENEMKSSDDLEVFWEIYKLSTSYVRTFVLIPI